MAPKNFLQLVGADIGIVQIFGVIPHIKDKEMKLCHTRDEIIKFLRQLNNNPKL